jgi:hypothetical protein
MDREAMEILREADRIRQRKEPVERAIGRAVRAKGRDYAYYIALVSELREAASMDKVSIDEELRLLADGGDDDC